jgi:hypothetical protein
MNEPTLVAFSGLTSPKVPLVGSTHTYYGSWIAIWSDEANKEDVKMATQQTVQQVMDYLKSHPEVAKRAADYMRSHPDEVKEALRDVADERGWDLSKIDTAALKAEISKIAH